MTISDRSVFFFMSKGQDTKREVIKKAAALFNKQGFAGVSLSDLMKATGLKKGGLYNHFANKEEIMAEAFSYAFRQVIKDVAEAMDSRESAEGKLRAVVDFYRDYALNPTIEGGCPIINGAIEADDANPELRSKVQEAMTQVIHSLTDIIAQGISDGEFRKDLEAEASAIVIITQIDGGIVMTRALNDDKYMEVTCLTLHTIIDSFLN